jgi:hypothetical protein
MTEASHPETLPAPWLSLGGILAVMALCLGVGTASQAQSVLILPSDGKDAGMIMPVIGAPQTVTQVTELALGEAKPVGTSGDWTISSTPDFCIASGRGLDDPATQVHLIRNGLSDLVFVGISNATLTIPPEYDIYIDLAVAVDDGPEHAGRTGLRFRQSDGGLIHAAILSWMKPARGTIRCATQLECLTLNGRYGLHGMRISDELPRFMRDVKRGAALSVRLTQPEPDTDGVPPVTYGRGVALEATASLKGSSRAMSMLEACARGR